MNDVVDMDGFREALERKRIKNDLSAREVCRQAGISEATYSRIVRGKMVDLRTFGSLCRWLGMPADRFVGMLDGESTEDTRTSVAMLLASDPALCRAKDLVIAVLDVVALDVVA